MHTHVNFLRRLQDRALGLAVHVPALHLLLQMPQLVLGNLELLVDLRLLLRDPPQRLLQ